MDIVTFENVSKTYRTGETTVTALEDVSLKIPRGMFTAFVGPSGSGKTTALNLIGCLDQPTQGTVTVAGQAVGNMNRRQSAAFRGNTWGSCSRISIFCPCSRCMKTWHIRCS
jgi:putative ABC transport system ATP-binding protein